MKSHFWLSFLKSFSKPLSELNYPPPISDHFSEIPHEIQFLTFPSEIPFKTPFWTIRAICSFFSCKIAYFWFLNVEKTWSPNSVVKLHCIISLRLNHWRSLNYTDPPLPEGFQPILNGLFLKDIIQWNFTIGFGGPNNYQTMYNVPWYQ